MIWEKSILNGWNGLARLLVPLVMVCGTAAVKAGDEYTTELYETYCKACHGAAGGDVPVAFNAADWQQRLDTGLDKVVNNAINGIGNMPAQGSCMECTYEDFEELIKYMSVAKSDL